MRKHGAVNAEGHKIFLRLDFSHIDVKNIGKIFKGVEGNSNGKRKFLIIFKETEYEEIDNNSKNKTPFPGFLVKSGCFQIQSHKIVENSGEKHEYHVHRLAPGVEEKASDYQYRIL